jgi:hypothetical protein
MMIGGVVNWDPLVSLAGVLAVLVPLVMLLTKWERRSRDKAYAAVWKEVCHVLSGPHVHEGTVLRGRGKAGVSWPRPSSTGPASTPGRSAATG